MIDYSKDESLREIYLLETRTLMGKAEQLALNGKNTSEFESFIDEIFRIMHTIKSSSRMVKFNNNANLANSAEDLFYYVREEKPPIQDYTQLNNIVLEAANFLKTELEKIESRQEAGGDPAPIINKIQHYRESINGSDKAF